MTFSKPFYQFIMNNRNIQRFAASRLRLSLVDRPQNGYNGIFQVRRTLKMQRSVCTCDHLYIEDMPCFVGKNI